MKQFFKDLFSGQSDTSSKRFSAIVSLFSLIIVTFLATFKADHWVTPEFMFDGLALIAGGGLGLTVVEKIFAKGKSEDKTEKSE
jgi:lipoprotein signal peptidase